MATPSSIPAEPKRDVVNRIHRVTRGNRSLWYQMTVLQQPERARACGSGSKGKLTDMGMGALIARWRLVSHSCYVLSVLTIYSQQ